MSSVARPPTDSGRIGWLPDSLPIGNRSEYGEFHSFHRHEAPGVDAGEQGRAVRC
ncbi:hypothetical protein [Paenibacillus uliginis]|uniref:hypothetical protein n=1 Tax=Paenibacillus uliginis TaxID=683737 RepID=UPI001AECB673|nr:hypothetical protein [Paenibacillus uliginis]